MIGAARSLQHVDVDRARKLGAKDRDQRLDLIHDLDGVGVRLARHRDRDGALAVVPIPGFADLDAVDDLGDVAEPHRRAVAIGDDQRLVAGRLGELSVSACKVAAFCGPLNAPTGVVELAAATARWTSSSEMPRAASKSGSTWTRMAYFCGPRMVTCATPASVDSRCPILISANSLIVDSGSVFETSVSCRTAARPGSPSGRRAGSSSRPAACARHWRSPPGCPAPRRRCSD